MDCWGYSLPSVKVGPAVLMKLAIFISSPANICVIGPFTSEGFIVIQIDAGFFMVVIPQI